MLNLLLPVCKFSVFSCVDGYVQFERCCSYSYSLQIALFYIALLVGAFNNFRVSFSQVCANAFLLPQSEFYKVCFGFF